MMLTEKLGPLPVWAWGGLGAVGVGTVLLMMGHGKTGQEASGTTSDPGAPNNGGMDWGSIPPYYAPGASDGPWFQPSPPAPGSPAPTVIVIPQPIGASPAAPTPAAPPAPAPAAPAPTPAAPAPVAPTRAIPMLHQVDLARVQMADRAAIAATASGRNVNDPNVYRPIWQAAYPELAPDELEYAVHGIQDAFRSGIIPGGGRPVDPAQIMQVLNANLVAFHNMLLGNGN